MKTKHVPMRSCLGCEGKKDRGELLRIGIIDEKLVMDANGKLPGRGAYVCRQNRCITSLIRKKGKLSNALRLSMPHVEEEDFLRGILRALESEV
jgi:predicted RNA-binding protein YlxR (DUF448 family)